MWISCKSPSFSPNDELSNDTPYDYGTLKYKIPVFKGYKGPYRGTKMGEMPKN
jgi:hypothetical protein